MYSPHNRVITKEIEQENKTVGGIIISPNTSDVDNLAKLGEVMKRLDLRKVKDCSTVNSVVYVLTKTVRNTPHYRSVKSLLLMVNLVRRR